MSIYLDSSFVLSIFCLDSNSVDATLLAQNPNGPLWITPFCEFDVVNALTLRVFRKEDPPLRAQSALNAFEQDVRDGVFQLKVMPEDVYLRARQLSRATTARLGTRASDILHVAAALELGASEFFTFDRQQAKLAQSVKLKINLQPI